MRQCEGTTKAGRRCRITVTGSSRYCGIHGVVDPKRFGMTALGAAIGTGIVPVFGTIVGAVLGNLADRALVTMTSSKKRVFLSFDYDNDRALKHFMVGQAENDRSPFVIVDSSLAEAAPDSEWVERAAEAIRDSDLVMVMVGRETYRAQGVLIEVLIARQLGVKCVQIRGYQNRLCPKVDGAGRMYDWDWNKLDEILG